MYRKEDKSASSPGKICIAKACLKLRDVILLDTLTKHVKLDLVLVDGGKFNNESVGKAGTKVGSMSVNIGLYPGDETNTDDRSTSSSIIQMKEPTTSQNVHDGNTQIIVNGLPPQTSSSSSTPHPISVFLSNFAGTGRGTRNDVGEVAKHTMSSKSACHTKPNKQMHHLESVPKDNKLSMNKSNHEEKTTTASKLEPVKAPPVWLDIRVEQISKLRIDTVSGKTKTLSNCLTLDMTCSEPILSLTDLNQSFNSSEMQHHQCMTRTITTDKPCSWQIALEAERRQESSATVVTLQLHCVGSSEIPDRTLIGLAKIPFIIEPTNNSSQQKLCNLLPAIATNSWFDILDPKSSTQIGKVQVMVAVGMLRQIRGFPSICRSTLTIQKWWKRLKSMTKEEEKENSMLESPESLNLSEIKPPDSPCPSESVVDPEFDTVHAGFISQAAKNDIDSQVSSPDSLYEEWSQQSQSLPPMDKSGYSSTHHADTTTANSEPLTTDDTQHDNHTSSASVRDEDVTLDSALISEQVSKVEEELLPAVEVEASTGIGNSVKHATTSSSGPRPTEHKSDVVDALGNSIQDNAMMSTLKPMNLEVSFSRGRDETVINQRIGIDPPEEIKDETTKPPSVAFNRDPNSKATLSCKRKIGGVSSFNNTNEEERRLNKRYRVKENLMKQSNPQHQTKMTNPLQNESKASNNNAQDNNGEESETLCPSSDTSCDQDSDAEDDALTYRSLTSVMGSLNDINSRLLSRTIDEPQQKLDTSSVPATKSDCNHTADRVYACDHHHVNYSRQHNTTHAKHQVDASSSQESKKPDSPPACQMEPPEETRTPMNKRDLSNAADNNNVVKTCEKGSSPMSTTNLYADATTSPSGDSLLANNTSNVPQHQRGEDEHCRDESTAIVDEKQVASSSSKTNKPKVDEPCDNPDEECCNSMEDGEDVACLAHAQNFLLTTKGRGGRLGSSSIKRYRSSLLPSSSMPVTHHHLRGSLQYQLSGRRRNGNGSVLSPVLSPVLYSKLSPLGRGLLSRSKVSSSSFNKGKVDMSSEAKENIPTVDNTNNSTTTKAMDKERLERIFKS